MGFFHRNLDIHEATRYHNHRAWISHHEGARRLEEVQQAIGAHSCYLGLLCVVVVAWDLRSERTANDDIALEQDPRLGYTASGCRDLGQVLAVLPELGGAI